MKIYSLITARSGSKGLKNKNIYPINDIPLILYSVFASLSSEKITKTFISTDSQKYADLCSKYGVLVPFIRPKEISLDNTKDFFVFKHFLEELEKKNDIPDLIIHLRPTSPDRPNDLIDKCINKFLKVQQNYDSLRSITEIENRLLKSCFLKSDNSLEPIFTPNEKMPLEVWQYQRQNLPRIFKTDSRVDIIKTSIINKKSLHGSRCYGFDTNLPLIDIDTIKDINGISQKLSENIKNYNKKFI